MTESENQLKVDMACVVRFVAFGALAAFANVIPYLQTYEAYMTDGIEVAGWPFICYQIGGFSGLFGFYPWALMGDIIVAVILTGLATWIFRNGIWKTIFPHGFRKTLWKWKTWGTPYAE